MSNLYQKHSELLADNEITDEEVAIIRNYIEEDGELDLNDVKFLVGLLCSAQEICPAFDDLFFPILREVILSDGRIGMDEHFYLLKMLFADGHVRERERQFLLELREAATEFSPEFDELCDQVLTVPAKGWDVGGRET